MCKGDLNLLANLWECSLLTKELTIKENIRLIFMTFKNRVQLTKQRLWQVIVVFCEGNTRYIIKTYNNIEHKSRELAKYMCHHEVMVKE